MSQNDLHNWVLSWEDIDENWSPQWLIDRIWQKNGLNFILGAAKSHKSMLRRYLLACSWAEEPALGLYASRRAWSRCLTLIHEDPPEAEKRWIGALMTELGGSGHEPCMRWLQSNRVQLDQKPKVALLRDYVAGEGIDLICVDSLIAFHGADENKANELRPVLHTLTRLKEQATVVVVHHSGKPRDAEGPDPRNAAERGRGSSSIAGEGDTFTHVERVGQSDRHKLRFLTKHAEEPPLLPNVFLDPESWLWRTDERGLTPQTLLHLIQTHPGASKTQIIARAGFRRALVLDLLDSLTQQGLVEVRVSGQSHTLYPSS